MSSDDKPFSKREMSQMILDVLKKPGVKEDLIQATTKFAGTLVQVSKRAKEVGLLVAIAEVEDREIRVAVANSIQAAHQEKRDQRAKKKT